MPRIIVADDNSALGNVVRFHLKRAGYDVTLVNNGQDVLDHLREQSFDLVITDQQMPKRTGLEVCSEIRSDMPEYVGMPIILLTAKRLELDVESLKAEFGISRVFPKPFSPSELVEFVAGLLASTIG